MDGLEFQFGDFVQCPVDNDKTNSMEERTFDEIFCQPAANQQGLIYVYDIRTNAIRKQTRAIAVHENDNIADRIAKIAKLENTGLGVSFGDQNNETKIVDIADDDSTTNDMHDENYKDNDSKAASGDEGSVDSTAVEEVKEEMDQDSIELPDNFNVDNPGNKQAKINQDSDDDFSKDYLDRKLKLEMRKRIAGHVNQI